MTAKWRVRNVSSAASWGLREAVASPPPAPSPPPAGLPSWVPDYGFHSTVPILAGHMPADVFPSIYSSTDSPDPFIDFNASLALLGGTTKLGMFSSGHHSDGVNFTSSYVLDYSIPGWSTCNDSTSLHSETDPPDHGDNIFADNSVMTGHGYTGHVATPMSWPTQGFCQVFFGGSAYPNNVFLRPIASKIGGVTRMNSAPINDGTGQTAGSYPSACTWEFGGGVFMSGIANGQLYTPLIKSDGSIDTSYPGVGGNYSGNCLVVDERHQLLMAVNGYYSGTGSVSLNIVDLASKTPHSGIPVTNGAALMGNPDASSVEPYRCSWTWSVERDCAFGVTAQYFDPITFAYSVKVLRLRPPATGSRLDPSNPWICEDITTTHWPSDPVSGALTSLGLPANPPSSNLVMPRWVGALDSIIYVTQYGQKPQVIRPIAGGGPDPGVPPPPGPPPTPSPSPAPAPAPAPSPSPAPSPAPAPSGRSISVQLQNQAGAPAASLSGLRYAWFDQSHPDLFAAPVLQGAGGTTDSSGVFHLTLTGTALTAGQVGWLDITNSTGNVAVYHVYFGGPVTVA